MHILRGTSSEYLIQYITCDQIFCLQCNNFDLELVKAFIFIFMLAVP
jgi:hypothetical protein